MTKLSKKYKSLRVANIFWLIFFIILILGSASASSYFDSNKAYRSQAGTIQPTITPNPTKELTPTNNLKRESSENTQLPQQQIINNTPTATPTIKVPMALHDGSTINCLANSSQAVRDADRAVQNGEQKRDACIQDLSKYSDYVDTCQKQCDSLYGFQNQPEYNSCKDSCFSEYQKLNETLFGNCNIYVSSQKANLDFLIRSYCN